MISDDSLLSVSWLTISVSWSAICHFSSIPVTSHHFPSLSTTNLDFLKNPLKSYREYQQNSPRKLSFIPVKGRNLSRIVKHSTKAEPRAPDKAGNNPRSNAFLHIIDVQPYLSTKIMGGAIFIHVIQVL